MTGQQFHLLLGTGQGWRQWLDEEIRRSPDGHPFDSVSIHRSRAVRAEHVYQHIHHADYVRGLANVVEVTAMPGWQSLRPEVFREALIRWGMYVPPERCWPAWTPDIETHRAFAAMKEYYRRRSETSDLVTRAMEGVRQQTLWERLRSNDPLIQQEYFNPPYVHNTSDRSSDQMDAMAYAVSQLDRATRARREIVYTQTLVRAERLGGRQLTSGERDRIRQQMSERADSDMHRLIFGQDHGLSPPPPPLPPPADRHLRNLQTLLQRTWTNRGNDAAGNDGLEDVVQVLYDSEHREEENVEAEQRLSTNDPVVEAQEFTQETLAQMQLEALAPGQRMLTEVWSPREAMSQVIELPGGGKYACLHYDAVRASSSDHHPSFERSLPVTAIFRRS